MFLIDLLPMNPGEIQQPLLKIQDAMAYKQTLSLNDISRTSITSEESNFNINHQES